MVVAGGVYRETCLSPPSRMLMGSGGRAAFALATRVAVELHTFHPGEFAGDVVVNFAPLGVDVRVHASDEIVEFEYHYPLSSPRIFPVPTPRADPVYVSGSSVLRFGCLEGTFVVEAERAVFDPQSGNAPEWFGANGSKAGRLAVVCNAGEARRLTGRCDLRRAAIDVMAHEGAEVVVVKDGARGAHVHERGGHHGTIPAFAACGAHKIGSGDVFSAIFAHLWSEKGTSALDAAEAASRHAAHYVGTRRLPCPDELPDMASRRMRDGLSVIVAAECVSSGELWVLHEACAGLRQLGVAVRAIRVGTSGSRDLMSDGSAPGHALDRGDALLILASDAGPPLLAVAREALARGTPILAFAEREGAVAALTAVGCPVTRDLASAVYRSAWTGD